MKSKCENYGGCFMIPSNDPDGDVMNTACPKCNEWSPEFVASSDTPETRGSMIYIGVDNGLDGGIAAISASHRLFIDATPMPTITRTHVFKKTKTRKINGVSSKITELATDREIDGLQLADWILRITDSRPCTILIEECPEHAQQKSTMRSMGVSYGILIGAISTALYNYKLVVVRSGNPSDSWQRCMLGKCATGGTKSVALKKANELWPDEKFLATERSKTPHTGMIDAALIAEYGRILNL